jgi:alkanesulfonate monooxygenase SsuD/methylene tetrahydromethanopterin reductase-like flavin-dependent oxidoreductase (luciferase family)
VPMERPATPPGPIGLVLPTFVQETVPRWAEPPLRSGGRGSPDPGPVQPGATPLAELTGVCTAAEQLGADALWACDHLFWHGPSLESMLSLTVAAMATTTATLGTCVVQLPLRQAPAVAKQAATLQTLSQGRFILGVGGGSHAGEYDQAGKEYRTRGRQLDAGIEELRRSWATGLGVTSGDIEAGGRLRYRQLPEPEPIPVWVGGSSEAALRRAAILADGWMPLFVPPVEYRQALERLGKEIDRAGRPADAVTPSIVLFVSVDDDPVRGSKKGTGWMSSLYGIPAKAFERHIVSGTAAEVAEVVTTYRRAGAEHVAVYVTEDQPLEQFERLTSALAAVGTPARG